MRVNNTLRLFLLAGPSLLILLFAFLVFLLQRTSHAALLAQTSQSIRDGSFSLSLPSLNKTDSTTFASGDISIDIAFGPTAAILWICIAAYFAGMIDLLGVWELRRVEGTARHRRGWFWSLIIGNLALIGGCIGVLAYVCDFQNRHKGWQRSEDIGNDQGSVSSETWTCQVSQFFPNQGWANSACGLAKAARFLIIGLALSCLTACFGLWTLIRNCGGIKWLLGGNGRYAGFDSIYEMQSVDRSRPPFGRPEESVQPEISQPTAQSMPAVPPTLPKATPNEPAPAR